VDLLSAVFVTLSPHLPTFMTASSPRPAWLATVLACLGIILLTGRAIAAAPVAWDVAKIDGREYVSTESIKQFYNFTKMTRAEGTLTLENSKLEVQLKVGSNECLMNNVKFVFCQEICASDGKVYVSRIDLAKFIDPVLRPSYIKNAEDFRTVVLDPGHGGQDPGAVNLFGTEANYNIKTASIAKKLLEARGFKVVMTRTSDIFQSLQERVDIANAVTENSIYVSIHFNSGDRSARGIETFILSPPGVAHYGRDFKQADWESHAGNEHDSANIALATAVHGTILRRLGKATLDRGIKHARFSVLTGVHHPAILLEGGFMSHPFEARLIQNEAYQNAIASGVVDAIIRYRFAISNHPLDKNK
jgi:N-acetylmuramoyl-L-alanine amidase